MGINRYLKRKSEKKSKLSPAKESQSSQQIKSSQSSSVKTTLVKKHLKVNSAERKWQEALTTKIGDCPRPAKIHLHKRLRLYLDWLLKKSAYFDDVKNKLDNQGLSLEERLQRIRTLDNQCKHEMMYCLLDVMDYALYSEARSSTSPLSKEDEAKVISVIKPYFYRNLLESLWLSQNGRISESHVFYHVLAMFQSFNAEIMEHPNSVSLDGILLLDDDDMFTDPIFPGMTISQGKSADKYRSPLLESMLLDPILTNLIISQDKSTGKCRFTCTQRHIDFNHEIVKELTALDRKFESFIGYHGAGYHEKAKQALSTVKDNLSKIYNNLAIMHYHDGLLDNAGEKVRNLVYQAIEEEAKQLLATAKEVFNSYLNSNDLEIPLPIHGIYACQQLGFKNNDVVVSWKDIKKAYFTMAKKVHPDKQGSDSHSTTTHDEDFKRINNAYEVLKAIKDKAGQPNISRFQSELSEMEESYWKDNAPNILTWWEENNRELHFPKDFEREAKNKWRNEQETLFDKQTEDYRIQQHAITKMQLEQIKQLDKKIDEHGASILASSASVSKHYARIIERQARGESLASVRESLDKVRECAADVEKTAADADKFLPSERERTAPIKEHLASIKRNALEIDAMLKRLTAMADALDTKKKTDDSWDKGDASKKNNDDGETSQTPEDVTFVRDYHKMKDDAVKEDDLSASSESDSGFDQESSVNVI